MTTFVPWADYPLPSGTVTVCGKIVGISDTAYRVVHTEDETMTWWVPFSSVHGPYKAATPLVVLG